MSERSFDLRLPPAPYRFQWRSGEPAQCAVTRTAMYEEHRYTHADGHWVAIRHYRMDDSYRVMADQEIELFDNANDVTRMDPQSIVILP